MGKKTEPEDVTPDPDALSAPIDPDGPQPGSPEAPTYPEDSNYPPEGRQDDLPVFPGRDAVDLPTVEEQVAPKVPEYPEEGSIAHAMTAPDDTPNGGPEVEPLGQTVTTIDAPPAMTGDTPVPEAPVDGETTEQPPAE